MLRYSLRQLEYFKAASELGSVAAAAKALNVSQPSISTAIAKLEAQLGVQLLFRQHAQGVSPTPNGQRLLQDARSLLQHADELQRQAAVAGGEISGELRLGSFVTLAPAFLPRLMTAFRARYLDVRLSIGEGTQDDLLDGLAFGRFELALLYDVDLPEDVRVRALIETEPHVLLPAGHPLACHDAIRLEWLRGEPMILLDVPPSRSYFLGLLDAAGISPEIAFSSPSLELVRGLVGQGLGYSILVTRPAGDMTYDGEALAIRPIIDRTEPGRIALAASRQLRPTRLMTAFEEFCVGFFAGTAHDGAPARQ